MYIRWTAVCTYAPQKVKVGSGNDDVNGQGKRIYPVGSSSQTNASHLDFFASREAVAHHPGTPFSKG